MTDNLQNKFDALQQQLATQHGEVIAQLQAIAAALGAPPPGGQITLADVLAVLQDIHTDTQSQDQKLLLIRNAVRGDLTETPPAGDLVSLQWLLYRLVDAINPTWPRSTSVPILPALDLLQEQFSPMTASWWQGILGIPQTGTDNMLAWLACICNAANVDRVGALPSPDDPLSCDEPVISGSLTYQDGRTFAVWNEPPDRTDFTSTYGLPNGVELSASGPIYWEGWRIYVQSPAATYSEGPDRTARVPTNTWRSLVGNSNYPLAISVEGDQPLTVYLCAGAGSGCETYYSASASASGGYNGTHQAITTALPGCTMVATVGTSNGATTWTPAIFQVGDVGGRTIRLISGNGARYLYRPPGTAIDSGAGYEVLTISPGGGPYVLFACAHFAIDDGGQYGPFAVEICDDVV